MPTVRTLYDPRPEIDPEFISVYSDGIYYCYGPATEGKHFVIAVVHDLSGISWVVDAEQDIIDRLSSYVLYLDTPNPLFYIAVVAYGKYAQAIAPNPTGNTYFGHRVVSRRPSNRTWEYFRNIEYQIVQPIDEPEELLSSKIIQ